MPPLNARFALIHQLFKACGLQKLHDMVGKHLTWGNQASNVCALHRYRFCDDFTRLFEHHKFWLSPRRNASRFVRAVPARLWPPLEPAPHPEVRAYPSASVCTRFSSSRRANPQTHMHACSCACAAPPPRAPTWLRPACTAPATSMPPPPLAVLLPSKWSACFELSPTLVDPSRWLSLTEYNLILVTSCLGM